MIQRVQSIYLLLAAIALTVLFFLPIASFYSSLSYSHNLYVTHLKPLSDGIEPIVNSQKIIPLGILAGITAAISVLTIFMYKKRLVQIKIVRVLILFTAVLLGLIFFVYGPMISRITETEVRYESGYGLYLILTAFILLFLAHRGIVHDEKLVRSADRLR
jgi:hypothetical protein